MQIHTKRQFCCRKNEAYNGSIPTNGSVSFGFNISYSGTNVEIGKFTVN